ncbi:hypothetical protein GYMLUDRAFT_260551 [Collybiopsis luxurians FD-317 M1]|uniref:Zn(2)-C6 fungal-type domain-containing protein n=1 Tax=Collybiopsis luxurians FD-317 M1 TaxID=944289 RepID=A0A0D0BE68_9AGAR|nr:hypothetical protein GYMLUDRAFT_260551 [Collybiopsis luxurians FD-317 M1]
MTSSSAHRRATPPGGISKPLKRGKACLTCRFLKIRCDGVRPVCGPCQRTPKDDPCEYADGPGRSRLRVLEETVSRLEARLREYEHPDETRLVDHSYQVQQLFLQGDKVDISAVPEASRADRVDLHVQSSMLHVPEALNLYFTNFDGSGQYYEEAQDISSHRVNIDTHLQRTDPRSYYPSVHQSAIRDMSIGTNIQQELGNPQSSHAHSDLSSFNDSDPYSIYDQPLGKGDMYFSKIMSYHDSQLQRSHQRDHNLGPFAFPFASSLQKAGISSSFFPPQQSYQSGLQIASTQGQIHAENITQYPQSSPAHRGHAMYPTRSHQIASSICRFRKDDGTECGLLMNKDNVDSHIYSHLPKVYTKNERIPQMLCWWQLETGKECGQLCKDAKVLFRHVHTHHKIKVTCPYPLCKEHLSRGRQDVIWRHLERVHGLPIHPKRRSERHFNGDRFCSGYPKKEALTWNDIRELYGENSREWSEVETKIQEEKASAGEESVSEIVMTAFEDNLLSYT